MRNSLILGVNGQDGSYLAEILSDRGDRVHGVGKQSGPRYLPALSSFQYLQCDLRDQNALNNALVSASPDEIYHVAAIHGPAGFSYEEVWAETLDVNVKSLHTVLEYSRRQKRDIRIFYASSGKIFGTPLKNCVCIGSPKRTDCLYSVSKIAAENLLNFYRKEHGLHACIAYLFNHESVRRPSDYFLPKVMAVLTSAVKQQAARTDIFTLDFYCDWGCAREYMNMAVRLIRNEAPEKDLIFATGRTWYARDFVKELFLGYGLDHRDYLIEKVPEIDSCPFRVDITETVVHLGSAPSRNIFDVCREFIDSESPGEGNASRTER